jgi:uncharacterized protein with PIN domain
MRVACAGCGREYDPALFEFGRTIHCTCGARVGLEASESAGEISGEEPRFLADAMLGRLARWLRLLGFDTAYDAAIPDADLARRAFDERRIVLTRDRALPEEWRLPRVIVLRSESLREQLRELARDFPLRGGARLFSRCSRCNAPLEEVTVEAIAERLPPRVRERRPRLRQCRACGRAYWEGSHAERIRRALDRIWSDGQGA